jgi:hypothetical protein
MNRDELIARKGEVQAEIARLTRQIEQLRGAAVSGGASRGQAGRIADLQAQLDAAMAEEAQLRQQIDRTRH